MDETLRLIEQITISIQIAYKADPSCPSLVISKLGVDGEWYVGIVRYTEAYGEGKKTVLKAKAHTLAEAIRSVSDQFAHPPAATTTPEPDELVAQLEASLQALNTKDFEAVKNYRHSLFKARVRASQREKLLVQLDEKVV